MLVLDQFHADKEWDYPRILLDNNCKLPSRVRAILHKERKDELVDGVNASFRGLASMGASLFLMPCNTVHSFAEQFELPEGGTLFNIISATMELIPPASPCYLMASEGTILAGTYEKFNDRGVELISPDEDDQRIIRGLIEDIKQNRAGQQTMNAFAGLVARQDAGRFILGCTELSVLYDMFRDEIDNLGRTFHDSLLIGVQRLTGEVARRESSNREQTGT